MKAIDILTKLLEKGQSLLEQATKEEDLTIKGDLLAKADVICEIIKEINTELELKEVA